MALQALGLLVRAGPAGAREVPDARFVLVGGRSSDITDLERLAREVGAEDHLRLLPARPQSDMPAFMAAAQALLSPRVQGINPPGKLFSYLSSGRPVVATDCPVHNQILDADCAILTGPDPESFAQGVIAALTDAGRVQRVVAEAKRVLETRYHPDRRTESYRRLLALAEAARRTG